MDARHSLAIGCGVGLAGAAALYFSGALDQSGGKVRRKSFPKIDAAADSLDIELNEDRFLRMLEKLVTCAEFVQNNPPDLVPQEGMVVDVLMEELGKYKDVLKIEEISFVKGRSNLIITYPGTDPDKCISLLGSHLDVVPVNREEWTREPFKMSREGDLIYGRGTTDCLGHVALITDFFCQLAEKKPKLRPSIIACFIASEENSSIPGVGVDALMQAGKLDHLRNGPLLWVDSADSQPCMGTAGALTWHLTVTGKKCHSGMPSQGINPLQLGPDALYHVLQGFYKHFPAHPEEERYKYLMPSTMKPTQMRCPPGGLNQVPSKCTISGDVRLTPFYDMDDVVTKMKAVVKQVNKDIAAGKLRSHHSTSKYDDVDGSTGRIEIEFEDTQTAPTGVACNVDSRGFAGLCAAIGAVKGQEFTKPYSLTGSLPLVREMKDKGFDIQITGFGLMKYYHKADECCSFQDIKDASKILSNFVSKIVADYE